jgi:protein tyrosine phosphatase (PTP) superfamily phosphohydrolase (DUF442 family)
MKGRIALLGLWTVLAIGPLGCTCCRPTPPATGSVSSFGACNSCSPVAHLPRGRLAPQPVTPAPTTFPPAVTTPPAATIPPAGFSPQPGGGQPQPDWQPSTVPNARLLPPGPVDTSGPQTPGPSLRPTQPTEPYRPQPTEPPASPEPPVLDVDVPGFMVVKPRVASGQKPFADGLNWLREKGYRAVLHVHLPGEDETAARRQFEAKGFRYLSLTTSPQTLSREQVEKFNRTVADPVNQPLYVYDRDGSLAGGLWYLHFRIVEGAATEKARTEAIRFGLNPDAESGPHLAMWLAVQRYLEVNRP